MNFNEKLINLRKSKGLSQEELGNELKVSRQTISSIGDMGHTDYVLVADDIVAVEEKVKE